MNGAIDDYAKKDFWAIQTWSVLSFCQIFNSWNLHYKKNSYSQQKVLFLKVDVLKVSNNVRMYTHDFGIAMFSKKIPLFTSSHFD